jgi:hypothetical protein
MVMENQYWSKGDPWAKQSWYYAELIEHPVKFVMGRRKRVYSLEVVPQGGTKLEWCKQAEKAFETESVTKKFGAGGVLLHAWSDDDLHRYVRKIVELAGYEAK